jgi:hypothetical protein
VNDLHAGFRCSVRNSGDGIRLGARFRVEQVKITDILTWGYFGKALRDATSMYNFKITTKFVDVVGQCQCPCFAPASPLLRGCCALWWGGLLKVVLVRFLCVPVPTEGGAGVVAVGSGGC